MDTSKTAGDVTQRATHQLLLINRNFALLWSGQAVSLLGDFVFNTTLVVWIAAVLAQGQAWTPLAVSGIFLAASAPTILFGPLAGVLVDRWDKRLAMFWTSLLQALCVALLLLQVSITTARQIGAVWQLGILYLVVFLVNSCEQIFRPSMTVLIGKIVAQNEQAKAIGLGQVSLSLAMMIGPALAPPILLAFGVHWALLVNMLSFLASASTIFFMRVPQDRQGTTSKEHTDFLAEFREGAHFLFNNQLLRSMLILSMIAWIAGGALAALDIFFATQNLHTTPALYGVLDTALGIGSILGAILASMFSERLGLIRLLWGSVLALGVAMLIYARLTGFGPALILIFLTGIPFATMGVVSGPLLLRATPKELLGRISALFNPLSTVALLLGTATAGYLDSLLSGHFHVTFAGLTFGPVDTIFTGAGLLLLVAGLYAMLSLHRADEADHAS